VFGGLIRFAPPLLYIVAAVLFLGGAAEMVLIFKPAVTDRQNFNLYEAIKEAFNPAMLGLGGSLCLFLIGYVAGQVRGGLRDRVLAILVLGFFVMIFWLAAEQAGNVLNIWADKNTDRYIVSPMQPAEVELTDLRESAEQKSAGGAASSQSLLERFRNMLRLKPAPVSLPEPRPALGAALGTPARLKQFAPAKQEKGWEMPTTWFQAINPLAIFVIAPIFAYLWIKLDKMGIQPSIPTKMVLGLALMLLSVVVMVGAAKQEGKESAVAIQGDGLPTADSPNEAGALCAAVGLGAQPLVSSKTTLEVRETAVVPAWWDPFGRAKTTVTADNGKFVGRMEEGKFKPFHAGLLTYDEKANKLHAQGVLPDTERDVIIGASAPASFVQAMNELKEKSQKIDGKDVKSVEVTLVRVPPGFNMEFSGVKPEAVKFDAEEGKLIARKKLAEKEEKGLLVAAGEQNFRATIHDLYIKSNQHRVSSWWLFWSYILVTLGELCLSPVGLSMVSKLSPAKFATMMMGVWMLTSAFGNFAAGALGEDWGTTAPVPFFIRLTLIAVVGTLLLLILVRIVTKTMHGVK
jgi:dipeptide/tripeptide permease